MSFCPQCGSERPPGARGLYCRGNGKNCKRDRDLMTRNIRKECRLCGGVATPLAKALWRLYTLAKHGRDIELQLEEIERVRQDLKAARQGKAAPVQREPEAKIKYVYLIASGGYHKIGFATSITKRLAAIQVSSPYRCRLVYAIKSPEAEGLEKKLHAQFARQWKKGEWFELTPAQVALAMDIMDPDTPRPVETAAHSTDSQETQPAGAA